MWNELLTTALVGTKRRPFKLENLPAGKLGDLLMQLQQNNLNHSQSGQEHALLGAAAAYTLYRRSGHTLPLDETPTPEPCDLDDLAPCSPRAALYLSQMVSLGNYAAHLPEWLQLASSREQRVIDEYLPQLLTVFQHNRGLPEPLFAVLGKRGRWLAQQNPAWAFAVLPNDDAEWEFADPSARLYYLCQVRASDPARARSLVEHIWNSEKAETRGDLIQTLKVNLSLDDEPFLEAALDDRSAGVRLFAQSALANLPESAFSRRMVARAEQFIKIRRRGKKLIVDVTLPETCDDAFIRDGAPPEPPESSGMGARAFWLFWIGRSLPVSCWLGGDWTVQELVQTVNANADWRNVLLPALGDLAAGKSHHELAEALLDVGELDEVDGSLTLTAATPQAREAYVLQAFAADTKPLNSDHRAIQLLTRLCAIDHHWSNTLSLAFLDAVRETASSDKPNGLTSIAPLLPTYALKIDPTTSAAARALPSRKTIPVWAYALPNFIATLEYRQNLIKEFSR